MFNLLSNAAKFTEHGTITLTVVQGAVRERRWYHIPVTDSGIGMTPEQMDRLFQTFAQADASTTRTFGGTGLGLAIAKTLMPSPKGRHRCGQRSQDTGLPLPCGCPQYWFWRGASRRGDQPQAPTYEGGAHVLVIDDDPWCAT